MRKKLVKAAVVILLLLLPFGAHRLYRLMTAHPESIAIATGPAHGHYQVIGENLAHAIQEQLGVTVRLVPTDGSLENLKLLRAGRVQLALYQPGTERILAQSLAREPDSVRSVANVYSEVTHFIVRRGVSIDSPADLRGRRVAVGLRNSGDYAMSRVLLEHFGLDEDAIDARHVSYAEIEKGFEEGTLDAAILTAGINAPVFQDLIGTGLCSLRPVPYTEALMRKEIAVSKYRIPAGLYRSYPPIAPADDIDTVALRAQLITSAELSSGFVEDVTRIILSEEFLKRNGLGELLTGGRDFASTKPEFTLHPGALNFYEPELRPLLNPDFVDATEGMRSFIVSVMIAGFLLVQWWKQRQIRRKDHRLDRYIRSLLDIERRQMKLDDSPDGRDAFRLQRLLNEVTSLRQDALRDFSAHELSEDRAVDCFLEMCHALSDKLNAKILRQRLDQRLTELGTLLRDRSSVAETPSSQDNNPAVM